MAKSWLGGDTVCFGNGWVGWSLQQTVYVFWAQAPERSNPRTTPVRASLRGCVGSR